MHIRKKENETISDFELWEMFKEGSELAFEKIYATYFDRLFNYGCQFTSNKVIVEDALQELFLELHRRKNKLSSTSVILPYLYKAFRRKIIRLRDKENRFDTIDSSVTSFQIELSVEDEMVDAETKEEQKKALKRALNDISEKHREMIFLFYYENMTYEEIQEIQGFENIKSARNLLYKAISALKDAIKIPVSIFIGFSNIMTEILMSFIIALSYLSTIIT